MQSATVTVSNSPRAPVACPSTPSTISHPSLAAACHRTMVPCTWCAKITPGKRTRTAAPTARQRDITGPTLSSLHRPSEKPCPRVVIPATRPYRAAHSASSMRGTAASGTGTSRSNGGRSPPPSPTAHPAVRPSALSPGIDPLNGGSHGPQPLIDSLVAPLDLADIVDHGVALRGQRREQHRHAGPDVRTFHYPPVERRGASGPGPVPGAPPRAR